MADLTAGLTASLTADLTQRGSYNDNNIYSKVLYIGGLAVKLLRFTTFAASLTADLTAGLTASLTADLTAGLTASLTDDLTTGLTARC